METDTSSILRTPKDGCFEFYTGGWGTYIRPIEDPDANVILNKDDLKSFDLKEDIHKIPAELWQRWVQLCFYYVDKIRSTVEVSMRILRSEEDPSVYRFLIPEQKVTSVSVRADNFDKAVDIETGEEIEQYPPIGWIPVGSSHSHNTMNAFFSPKDDEYELGDPGIHIVVGSINSINRTYNIAASVVGSGRRFLIDYKNIIDATPVQNISFHKNVLSFVEFERATPITPSKSSSNNTTYYGKFNQKFLGNKDYNDPFHYSERIEWDSVDGVLFSDYIKEFKNDSVKLWQIEDAICDYIKENLGDEEKQRELLKLLDSFVDDIEEQFEESIEAQAI